MKTKFASAERDSREEVLRQKSNIQSSEFLDRILSETPFMFLILNDKRQVVYSNHLLMNHLGFSEMEDMAGLRPGELFRCIHSETERGGCGTAESCRYCGAVLAVLDSKRENRLVIRECILNMNMSGRVVAANYQVASRPFRWMGEDYYVVTLENIESAKRREQLERTFFHDLKNKAVTIGGFLQLIQDRSQGEDSGEYLEIAERGVSELLKEIEYQQQLLKAEAGELKVHPDGIPVHPTLQNMGADFREFANLRGVEIVVMLGHPDVILYSDPVLLKRVLNNLVKNAIEASTEGDQVTLTFVPGPDHITFCVRNPMVMTDEIRLQVFNRSFSTKGAGRGIGTYSIRLFTEDYLQGKVSFTSREPEGTEFRITLPMRITMK